MTPRTPTSCSLAGLPAKQPDALSGRPLAAGLEHPRGRDNGEAGMAPSDTEGKSASVLCVFEIAREVFVEQSKKQE